jgi:heterotetrameric sarcosine oxidase gamma subunit
MAVPEFNAGLVAVNHIEPLAVTSLRHLPGADDALAAALRAAALTEIPAPGKVLGNGRSPGTWALWRSPSEVTLIAFERATADAAMAALAADTLACAVDQTDGTLVLELQGQWVEELLQRLVDSHSLPVAQDSAVRVRLADIAVTLVRLAPERLWLLSDRSHAYYLANWLAYAGAALATRASEVR